MGQNSHLPCPYEDCGSSDGFSWNDDGVGYCFVCETSYPSKKNKRPIFSWVKQEYPLKSSNNQDPFEDFEPEDVSEVKPNLNGKPIQYRGITPQTMNDFGVFLYEKVPYKVKVGRDKYDSGIADELRFVYPTGDYKVRRLTLDKKHPGHFGVGGVNRNVNSLFGMDKFPPGCSKAITVTEGEIDALSVAQMLKSGYITPVVSLPSATPHKSVWEDCREYLDSFEQIILSVDSDEAGDKLADKMLRMFPNKIHRVNHGAYKDANDFLQAGKAQEFKSAWFNARKKKYTPANVLNGAEDFLELYTNTPEHQYVETGIQALDDKILGLMQAHFTVFKAPTGIGKTELMRYLEYHMVKKGIPIASWHLEETKLRSLLGLVSYELDDNVTRRDLIDLKNRDEDVRRSIVELMGNGLYYQFFLNEDQGPDELIEEIRFLSQACDVKFVFFEPIQDVVSGRSEENKEAILADLAVRLSKLAAELNVGIVTIAHTNEDGAVKYCKMIEQRASIIIRLERDKDAEDWEERNTTSLYIEKNRPTSEEGFGGVLKFDPEKFTLKEG